MIESLKLEKTSKIIKSNCQPNSTMPAKPRPEVPHLHIFFNTSRDGDSTNSLGSPFCCLTTLSVKKFFLISSLNLPCCNLRPLERVVRSSYTWLLLAAVKKDTSLLCPGKGLHSSNISDGSLDWSQMAAEDSQDHKEGFSLGI